MAMTGRTMFVSLMKPIKFAQKVFFVVSLVLIITSFQETEANAQMSVWRSQKAVQKAILKSRPKMDARLNREMAKHIRQQSHQWRIDPYTFVAIIHNESRFHHSVIGGAGGKCYGLGQICIFNWAKCDDVDSPWCKKMRVDLLNWRYNIGLMGSMIDRWRKYCRRKTRRQALFKRWLAGYQGYNKPSKGLVCGMRKVGGKWRDQKRGKLTRTVMNYRLKLANTR